MSEKNRRYWQQQYRDREHRRSSKIVSATSVSERHRLIGRLPIAKGNGTARFREAGAFHVAPIAFVGQECYDNGEPSPCATEQDHQDAMAVADALGAELDGARAEFDRGREEYCRGRSCDEGEAVDASAGTPMDAGPSVSGCDDSKIPNCVVEVLAAITDFAGALYARKELLRLAGMPVGTVAIAALGGATFASYAGILGFVLAGALAINCLRERAAGDDAMADTRMIFEPGPALVAQRE